jgi:hypothetical protein
VPIDCEDAIEHEELFQYFTSIAKIIHKNQLAPPLLALTAPLHPINGIRSTVMS